MKANSRKPQAAATKKKIYDSAVLLMKKHGLDSFTVDDVVKAAGVSKGTFYVHFKSKYSLIAEHVVTVDNDYEAFFRSIPRDKKASEMLMMISEIIVDVMINGVGFNTMRTIYEVALKKADGTAEVLNSNRKLNQIYKEILKRGVEQGEFKENLDIAFVANHFVMGIRGITFHWCVNYPDFDLRENVIKLFDIMLSGIYKN